MYNVYSRPNARWFPWLDKQNWTYEDSFVTKDAALEHIRKNGSDLHDYTITREQMNEQS